MKQSKISLTRSFMGLPGLSYQFWTWTAILASVLVCVLVASLHFHQQESLKKMTDLIASAHMARMELSRGFLFVTLSNQTGMPFDREEGIAILQQAASALDETTSLVHMETGQDAADFREKLAYFRALLLEFQLAETPDPGIEAALRIAFNDLEGFAENMDEQLHAELDAQAAVLDLQFRLTLSGAAVLLFGICTVLIRTRWAKEKTDKELREREKKLVRLLELLPVGVSIIDDQQKLVFTNPTLHKIINPPEDRQVAGDPFAIQYIDAEGTPIQPEAYAGARAVKFGQPIYDEETGIVKEDGSIIWTSVSAVPVDFPDWKTVIVTADITQRKQAQEEIERLLERLDVATQAAHMGIWDWDVVSDRMIWDDQMYRLYGFDREMNHLSSNTWLNSIHEDDRPHCDQLTVEALKSNINYELEFRVTNPDGTMHWLREMAQVVRDPSGAPLRMVGITYDITDRKRAEQELFESREDLRILLSSMDRVVARFDRDGTVLYVNDAAVTYLGLRTEEIIGKNFYEVFPKGFHPVELGKLHQVIDTGVGIVEDAAIELEPGKRRWFRASLQPVYNPQGKPIQAVMTSTDITEIKEAQTRLEEYYQLLEQRVVERTEAVSLVNAELVRANQAKNEFLSTMSHELRTPLNGILSLSESLQEGTYGPVNDRQVRTLGIIHESGDHLLNLINDILDISKAESGRLELQTDTVVLHDLLAASLRLINSQAQKKHQLIRTTVNSDMDHIIADGRRLKQMLVNLLSNAVKFTPEGGQIGVEVAYEYGDPAMRFTVTDTGIGIAKEKIERLFQPFVQLDSRLAREYTGTGLGLALVRRMAQLHGGSVGVESEEGKGSRFWFEIPVNHAVVNSPAAPVQGNQAESASPLPQAAQRAGSSSPAQGELRGTIVFAEDHLLNLESFLDFLKLNGYRVIPAINGSEAIQRVVEFKPDIVLMDIQMPGMDGIEAIRRLRAKPEYTHLPIIAITALAMPGDKDRCLAAGANTYLVKPVGLRQLLRAIEDLIS